MGQGRGDPGLTQRGRAACARVIRATRILARDERIPRPLRWGAALALLPIPGPFDEALLLLIAPVFLVFYRHPMHDAWSAAGTKT